MGHILSQHDSIIHRTQCCDLSIIYDYILAYLGYVMPSVHHSNAGGIDILCAFHTVAMLILSAAVLLSLIITTSGASLDQHMMFNSFPTV